MIREILIYGLIFTLAFGAIYAIKSSGDSVGAPTNLTALEAIAIQQNRHFDKYGEYMQVLPTRTMPQQAKRGLAQTKFDISVVPDDVAIYIWNGGEGDKGYEVRTPTATGTQIDAFGTNQAEADRRTRFQGKAFDASMPKGHTLNP